MPQKAPPHPWEMPYQIYWPLRKSIFPLVESIALPLVSNFHWRLLEKVAVIVEFEAGSANTEAVDRAQARRKGEIKEKDHIMNGRADETPGRTS